MAIQYITGSAANQDKGVIRRGGTIASTRFTSKSLISNAYYNNGRVTEVKDGVAKGVAAGTLNKLTQGKYVIRSVSEELAGVAYPNIKSPGSDTGHRDSIHKSEVGRKTFLTGVEQTLDADGNVVITYTRSESTTSFEEDKAARPTRAVPGSLTFKEPKAVPVTQNYSEKTG